MAAVSTYHVAAKRWGAYWELHIDGVGVTQSRTLLAAERIVRDYLALDGHTNAATASIDIRPELDGDLAAEAEAARQAVRDVEAARKASAARSRVVARRLRRSGLSGADIAAVLGVSTQRVSQLVND
jgi:DNA-directed RNA polymerase specialized sigma24 family protein